nr:unnamed protein product [Callosobruchus analis]
MAESYSSRRLVSFQILVCVHFELFKRCHYQEDIFQLLDGSVKEVPTTIRLTPGSSPSIFPNSLKYISKKVPVPKKSPAERSQVQIAHKDHLNKLF